MSDDPLGAVPVESKEEHMQKEVSRLVRKQDWSLALRVEILEAELLTLRSERDNIRACLDSLTSDIHAAFGDRYRTIIEEESVSVNTAFRVALRDEREAAKEAAEAREQEPLTCEFCHQPEGGIPSMLEVCPACWSRANEGSGWMQRAMKAEAELLTLRAERDELRKERDREKARTDIVIAEFDAPWPHSHTVADVVSRSLVWQIHQCRAGTEARAEAAEAQLAEVRAVLDDTNSWTWMHELIAALRHVLEPK